MSELSDIDQALMQRLKQRIQQLSGLPFDSNLSQKDFDFLVYYVQDKTGQALSLTTMKRIWRDEYQRLPHLSTLNMLAQLAYEKDWHTLKMAFIEEGIQRREDGEMETMDTKSAPQHVQAQVRFKNRMMPVMSVLMLLAMVVIASGYYASGYSQKDLSSIAFSASPTAELRIPNSVVFSYDVSSIDADHFYIQQSWDPGRKVEISRDNKNQTDIYFEPGYHYAKLLVNDQVAKEIPVHIKYDDWYVRFRYPDSKLIKVDEADIDARQNYLGLKPDYVTSRLSNSSDDVQLGYMLSKDFGLSADDFQISGRVKFDSTHAPVCPMITLLIKGDRDYAWITVCNSGCEGYLNLKVGDTRVDGKTNDLSSLGVAAFSWQQVTVNVHAQAVTIAVHDKLVYAGTYSNSLGELKEIDFFFNGIGSIDKVSMQGNKKQSPLSQNF